MANYNNITYKYNIISKQRCHYTVSRPLNQFTQLLYIKVNLRKVKSCSIETNQS